MEGRFSAHRQPIRDPREWERAVAAANPALLLLFIDQRLGHTLKGKLTSDDLLQEALLEAWRFRSTFEGDFVDFRNWLMRIIEHRIHGAADHFNAAKRGGGAIPASIEALAESPHHSTTPSRVAWYREQAQAIQTVIASLPEDLRLILRQRLIDRIPIAQIAERQGLTVSVVRRAFRKASEMLRTRLIAALGTGCGHSSAIPAEEGLPGQAASPD